MYDDEKSDLSVIHMSGEDQLPLTSRFEARSDMSVVHNYGKLLLEMASIVPDGIVSFFPRHALANVGSLCFSFVLRYSWTTCVCSYRYLEDIVVSWNDTGMLTKIQ